MGLFACIDEVLNKSAEILNGYSLLAQDVYGGTINLQNRVNNFSEKPLIDILYDGFGELIEIKNDAKLMFNSYINRAKNLFTEFTSQYSKSESNTSYTKNNSSIDDIIKSDFSEKAEDVEFTEYPYYSGLKNMSSSYKANIEKIVSEAPEKTAYAAKILSGHYMNNPESNTEKKPAWKWKDREKIFLDYISNTSFSKDDVSSLEQLKYSLQSNRYAKRKHKDIMENIENKINVAMIEAGYT